MKKVLHRLSGAISLPEKKVLHQFLQYLKSFRISIFIAMGCALVVSICELGRIQLLADTLDSLKKLENFKESGVNETITIFQHEHLFKGIEFTLTGTGDAFRFYFWILLGVLAIVLVKGVFVYISDFLMDRVGNKVSLRIRNDLYDKIISTSLRKISQQHSGDIMTRVTDDVRGMQQAVTATASILRALIQVVIFVSVMLYKSILMTLLSILVLPLVAFSIYRIGGRVRKASEEIQQKSSDIYTQLKETLSGISIIKSFTAEDFERQRFEDITTSQYRMAIRRSRFAVLLPPLIEWMGAIGTALVFGLGCWQVINGALSIGWFASYIVMVALMYKPVKIIGSVNTVLQQSLASGERIFELMKIEREQDRTSENETALSDIKGVVEFRDVDFAYKEDLVVKNVSFKADPGQVIAFVGPSGSGKTTLLHLLQRFYTVSSGTILIDDNPIETVTLESLRQNIALVPQDTFLFDGTVQENIAYGTPDVSLNAIADAAKKANAHDFIMSMTDRYNEQIGESGGKLSGGEQQRISIARAFLKDAPILILDEATSALDSQSEAVIQKSLLELMHGRTCFIIAHRLSTVQRADTILVLKDGSIVERGTHADLVEKGGLYQKMCEQQVFE